MAERFTEVNLNKTPIMVKSLLRGKIKHQQISNTHVIKLNKEVCDGFGVKSICESIHRDNPDYKYYYFDHYYTKSAEEYLSKLSRGSAFWGNKGKKIDLHYLSSYFDINKITLDKINYFENKTGINLSNIRERLKNNN